MPQPHKPSSNTYAGTLHYLRKKLHEAGPAPVSATDAARRLTKDVPFSKRDINIFERAGISAELQRFKTILHDPDLLELDLSYIRNEITVEEHSDLLIMLPELSELQHELAILAKVMGRKLGALAVPEVSRGNMIFAVSLYSHIKSIGDSQLINNFQTFRNTVVITFCEMLIEEVTLALIEAEDNGTFLEHRDVSVQMLMHQMQKEQKRLTGGDFSGLRLRNTLVKYRKIFEQHRPDIKKFMFNGDITEKDATPEMLQERADTLYREIFELANIAPVSTVEKNINGLMVRIIGNDDADLQRARYNSLFFVQITFPSKEDLKLVLDRHSGELIHIGTNIPMDYAFGPQYPRIKLRILEAIRAHLEDPNSIIALPATVRKIEDTSEGEPSSPDQQQLQGSPEVIHPEDELSDVSDEVQRDAQQIMAPEACAAVRAEYQEARTHLRGLKASRTETALASLLGLPRPFQGSHRVYTGRDGSSVMMAMHSGKEVPGGLLRKFLKKSGVSIREFLDAY